MSTSTAQNAYSNQRSTPTQFTPKDPETIGTQVSNGNSNNSNNNNSNVLNSHANGYILNKYAPNQQNYLPTSSTTLGPTQNKDDYYLEYDYFFQNPLYNGGGSFNRESKVREMQKIQIEQSMELTRLRQKLKAQPYEPVYNTKIRHGFAADYESEKYMKKLAEV